MKKRYRVGIVGFSHMHIVEHVQYFLKVKERIEWIGAAPVRSLEESQTEAPLTRKSNLEACRKLGVVPVLYEDYRKLLEEKPDLILLGCENALHTEVVCEIVRRGIHVLVDKPLAYSLESADRMREASLSGGGEIITNWPTTWKPSIRLGRELVEEGAIGEVFRFHFHNPDSLGPFSHGSGMNEKEYAQEWWYQKKMGGGSLIDYCGYGCNLALDFFKKRPETVSCFLQNVCHPYSDTEDYAALTIKFPDAVGILEGVWSTFASGTPTGPTVWGTEGALEINYAGEFCVKLFQEKFAVKPTRIFRPDTSVLPKGRSSIEEEVLHYLDTGLPLQETLSLKRNLEIAAILQAAEKAAKSRRVESIMYLPENQGEGILRRKKVV